MGLKTRLVIIATIIVALFSSCDKENPSFKTFTFEGIKGSASIDDKEHTVHAKAYDEVDLSVIVAKFTLTKDATAKIGSVEQVSGVTVNDFTQPVIYELTGEKGKKVNWTVVIEKDISESKLKSATIHYTDSEGNSHYLCFDNYGKQRRWEGINSAGERGIFIHDDINKRYHIWSSDPNGPGWLPDEYVTPANIAAVTDLYFVETYQNIWSYWDRIPGATRTTETIAGQNCTVYAIPTDGINAIYAIWANTVLLRIEDGEDTGLEAQWAHTGSIENAFTKTVDIDWK